jgi:parallel beta-helix repeat protein
VSLDVWQYNDGMQPPAEATFDNLEVWTYKVPIIRYVDAASASPTPPYTNWTTAASVIQDAVDAAAPGDIIVVTNGIYATGGRPVGTNVLVNRAAVHKPITLRSVNGPQFTVIEGHQVPGTTNGDSAIRCVYLADGASLSGFTLINGATRTNGDCFYDEIGGGVFCDSTNAQVMKCVIASNSAYGSGGGASGGTLSGCTLTANSATGPGGGAAGSMLDTCILTDNSASCGGGAWGSTLNNCALTGNTASLEGGGVWWGTLNDCTLTGNSASNDGGGVFGVIAAFLDCPVTLNNCIVYFNKAPLGANYSGVSTLDHCCTTPMPTNGLGNITNAPLFVDYTNGNLHLQSNSPCINAGNNAYASGPTDLESNPRVVRGTVDIGAYEYQGPGSIISYAWLQQYGLPTDGSADYADPDDDGMNNWQEWLCGTCPTNASSALRMLSAVPSHTTASVTVTWQSAASVSYFVERSTNLAASPPFSLLATNLSGQPGTTSFTDNNAASMSPLFYRVGVGN